MRRCPPLSHAARGPLTAHRAFVYTRCMRRWLLSASVLLVLGCGSESEPASTSTAKPQPDGGSDAGTSGSKDGSTPPPGDPCAALASGTDLSGCIPMYCACADGTVTRSGGGCTNGVGTANCSFGCAQHGGSGTPTPVENVYASAECLAYCKMLFGLGCSASANDTIASSVSKTCSFIRTAPLDAGATTCAEAARTNLTCIVQTHQYTCSATGFSGSTGCGVLGDPYEDGCAR
jgi:hypothetical protein